MILGASYSQLPLYEAARKLGAATVAASTPGDWPGFAVADESVYADITNPEAILKAAQEKGIDGIATCCLDAGVRALGYTCEKMGLIGPSARAADISNDKFKMKEAFMAGGVQCARHICIHSLEELEEALGKLEFPVVLKAVDLMGSRGIFRCNTREETFFYYNKTMEATRKDYCLVEEFIDGHEIEVAVLGNEEPTATFAGEIAPSQEFYTFEAKYVDGTSGLYIPAHISEKAMQTVREDAVRVYRALGCKGLSRVDFFCTYAEDEIVFNEINTIPGFTSISMYPKLQEHMGLAYADLIDKLIGFAMERYDG